MTEDSARLAQELEELREAVLEDWIVVTTRNVDAIRAMEQSFSWRLTRPLRLFRSAQLRAREIGYVQAGQLVATRLAARAGRAQ